uniref:Ig-like domain-containing protein n=1 Tax=Lepisosteus oculatus TaxID=7918 RepID=W5N796_LEPOC
SSRSITVRYLSLEYRSIVEVVPTLSSCGMTGFVDLVVKDKMTAKYDNRITLNCSISSKEDLGDVEISWVHFENNDILCNYNSKDERATHHQRAACTFGDLQLSLTLHRFLPSDEGMYICKLRSKAGMKHTNTTVQLQDQFSRFQYAQSSSQRTCTFYEVYPQGEVHWFDEDRNVTEDVVYSSSNKTKNGLFNITSTYD